MLRRRGSLALVGILLLSVAACQRKPPRHPGRVVVGPKPPPAEQRMSPSQLEERKKAAASRIKFPPQDQYAHARIAADIARGGPWRLGGMLNAANYFAFSLPAYAFKHGGPDAQAEARRYYRLWLQCERDGGGPKCGGIDWRKDSTVCSLNHQMRNIGIHLAVQVLGQQDALRYGDRKKILVHEEHAYNVITGAAWYGKEGDVITEGSCKAHASAGTHPEGYRSRHYWSRAIVPVMTACDCGSPKVSKAACAELDEWWKRLKPCIRKDGVWDPKKKGCEDFRRDTCTRCPAQPGCEGKARDCWPIIQQLGLNCHPEESPVIGWILNPEVEWRPEFANNACDNPYFHFIDGIYLFGDNWQPKLNP